MMRRSILVFSLLTWAMGPILAAERATFILTDGERKSGAVVFHGANRENLIDNHLNLSNDETGKEQTFTVDQVAVIDFVGGRPPAAELQALPANNSGNLLALKNGMMQTGTFVNMIGGETVLWKNQAGQEQQYPIRDVVRIYLNVQSARVAFDAPASSTPVATTGQVPAGVSKTVQVSAKQQWTGTGITVKRGDLVAFRATGQIAWGSNRGETAGPEGNANVQQPGYPVGGRLGALIGAVFGSAPFEIGANSQPIAMPADGPLLLGVNDNNLGDNGGAFTVVVTQVR